MNLNKKHFVFILAILFVSTLLFFYYSKYCMNTNNSLVNNCSDCNTCEEPKCDCSNCDKKVENKIENKKF